MTRLYTYFGVVGIASMAAWGAALLLLAAFAFSRRRSAAYLAAFLLSLAGFILAKINSHQISQIEVDRSAEEAALRAGAPLPIAPRPSTLVPPGPAYRGAGKQKREEGTKLEQPGLTAVAEEAPLSVARRLPEAEVIRADAYDRLNLFFARLTPWLALLLVCLDYASRFNRTFGYLPPVPIAGRALDALFPKTHAVHVQAADPALVRRYLVGVVRKGETFVCLGPARPVAGSGCPLPEEALHRWALGRLRWRPLAKVAVTGAAFPSSEFVGDSAWFGRYCFVATDAGVARRLVADLIEYLRARTGPRAAAGRTVSIVWHFPEALPLETLASLAALCKETNFKLVVFSAGPPGEETAPLFDERLDISKGD